MLFVMMLHHLLFVYPVAVQIALGKCVRLFATLTDDRQGLTCQLA